MGELAEQEQTKPIYFWTGTIVRQSRLARLLIKLAMWIDGAPVPRFKTESDADYVQRLREGNIG